MNACILQTWTASELYKPIEQRRNRHWAWTQFSKTLPLPEDIKMRLARGEQVKLEVTSKAMNSDFNVQPETMEPFWNARGVCINHWYHVKVSREWIKYKPAPSPPIAFDSLV
jgi:sulfite oxidase